MKKRILLKLDYKDYLSMFYSFKVTLEFLDKIKNKSDIDYDLINRIKLICYQLDNYKGDFK